MRRATGGGPLLAAGALIVSLALGPAAHAHGLEARQGILRLVGRTAILVLTPPASAFARFDDDRNGLLHATEVRRHRDALLAEVHACVEVTDERGRPGEVVFADAVVPHAFDGTSPSGTDHLRLVLRYRWGAAPRTLGLRYDLSGAEGRGIRVTAVRERSSGAGASSGHRVERALVTAARPVHRFFDPR